VGTRPKVHQFEVERAIEMIAKRRKKVDDSNLDRLPDSACSDPREVLDYLRKFSGIDIPRWVLQADVSDALVLNNWLWWEDRRRELHFLKSVSASRACWIASTGSKPCCVTTGPTRRSPGRRVRPSGRRGNGGPLKKPGSLLTVPNF